MVEICLLERGEGNGLYSKYNKNSLFSGGMPLKRHLAHYNDLIFQNPLRV